MLATAEYLPRDVVTVTLFQAIGKITVRALDAIGIFVALW